MIEVKLESHINELHIELSELRYAMSSMSRSEKRVAKGAIRHCNERIRLFEKLRADADDAS